LTLSRAVALVGVGRLRDSEVLIERVRNASDPAEDAAARVEADALAADLALSRGENARAAEIAQTVLTPTLENTNWQDYMSTWLTLSRALQRSGQISKAAGEIKRMRNWAENAPGNERPLLYVVLSEADQAKAEGHADEALTHYADAMARAERSGIPEDIVEVGEPYAALLIETGQIDRASAVGGRLAQWSGKDMRAAWTQAQLYQALRKTDAARDALARARTLAGERAMPCDSIAEIAVH
jgi:tetratricopeptide (TPR) repeat protein